MSSLKRKRNLLDDKQKHEIISYAKENPKLTQQQIANNLPIKWDLLIKKKDCWRYFEWKRFFFFFFLANMYYLYLCLFTSAKYMSVELKQFEKVYLFIWSHDFRFSMSLSLSPNSLYRQTTDCTEGGGLTREHLYIHNRPIWYQNKNGKKNRQ